MQHGGGGSGRRLPRRRLPRLRGFTGAGASGSGCSSSVRFSSNLHTPMGSAGAGGAGSGFGRCLSKGRSPTHTRRNPQSGSISSLAGIVRSLATSRAPSPSRYPPAARIAATRRSACSLLLRFRLCLASCAAVGVSSPNAGTIGEVGASTHIDLFPRSLSVPYNLSRLSGHEKLPSIPRGERG